MIRPVTALPSPTVEQALTAPTGVSAGFPSPAQDYYEGPVDLNRHLIRDPTSTYILRVAGHSMAGAGIDNGDEIVVDRGITPRTGHVVVAILDGELVVKRLRFTDTGVVLEAANPDYPDIEIPELSELEVWGVVTRCLHHV